MLEHTFVGMNEGKEGPVSQMKRNRFLLIFLIALSLLLISGCSSNTDSKSDDSHDTDKKTATLDESLSGAALLSSLNFSYPDSLKMTTQTVITNSLDATSTTYTKGENFRMEMDLPDIGKQITIYNAADGITYQYTEGQTTGISFSDQDMSADQADSNLTNMEEGMTSIDDLAKAFPDNVVARVETLNGEKVIYVETTEDDSQNGTVDMHMWFSIKYGVPLKTEVLSNGTVTMSTVVTDISADTIADSQFMPPANVVFTDFSSMGMDNLMDIPSP